MITFASMCQRSMNFFAGRRWCWSVSLPCLWMRVSRQASQGTFAMADAMHLLAVDLHQPPVRAGSPA